MNKINKILILLFLSLIISILCIGFGSVKIQTIYIPKIIINKILGINYFSSEWKSSIENIIWNIRVPRIILAFITGASLSITGIIMQTITKNNLADPYILGISSGASAGAVSVIVLGNSYNFLRLITIEQGAFIGSLFSITAVFLISSKKIFTKSNLILTGVGVSAFFSACTTIIIYSSKNNSQLVTAMFWMTGSLSSASWSDIFYPFLWLVIIFCIIMIFSYELDIFLMGDNNATLLGINTTLIKSLLLIGCTLLISIIVSSTGIIGFIGLIIPHISRKIVGYKHRLLTFFSFFLGGLFLVISDTFARTFFSPEEMPIGIITAFCGTPIFLMIIRNDYSFGGKE